MIKPLKLEIAKLRRDRYGHSAERRGRPIDQMEMRLEEREAAATEDAIAAARRTNRSPSPCRVSMWGSRRRRPVRAVARTGS